MNNSDGIASSISSSSPRFDCRSWLIHWNEVSMDFELNSRWDGNHFIIRQYVGRPYRFRCDVNELYELHKETLEHKIKINKELV